MAWRPQPLTSQQKENYRRTYTSQYKDDEVNKMIETVNKQQKSILERLQTAGYKDAKARTQLQRDLYDYKYKLSALGALGVDVSEGKKLSEHFDKVASEQDKMFSPFKDESSYLNALYSSKYKGKKASDIDSLIDSMSNSRRFLNQSGNQKELDWLKANRDSFMSRDELLSEIGSLENKSAKLKKNKWENRFDYAGNLIGGAFAGDTSRARSYNTTPETDEIENNARLKKLKELLAGRDDFDAESAYKKADEKNLWDVITTDYTYADYLNDKDSKNIYGKEAVRRRDEENNKIIQSNSDEFSADYSKVASIIAGKKQASAVSSSGVGDLLSGFMRDSWRTDEIMKTDPEIRKIIKKWSDKGYDFESLYNSFVKKENADFTEDQRLKQAENTRKNPVLSNIASVGTNVIGGISSLPSVLKTGIEDATSDDIVTLDINAPEWALKNVTDSIRDTTSQMISEKNDGIKREFLNLLYTTGMSIADNVTLKYLTGLNPKVMQVIMGTNAAADGIKSVVESGGSVDEAILTGFTNGIFEALFEKVSIDNLFRTATSDTGKKLIYNFFRGFLSEGSEELCTEIANTFADALINGNNSEFNNSVYNYMAEGKTAAEARSHAMLDTMKQMGLSFAGGALSGGVIAGVGGGVNLLSANRQNAKTGNEIINNGKTDALMDLALKNMHNSEVADNIDAINKYQSRVENKNFRTNGKNEISYAVEHRLADLGVTDSEIANRVTDAYFRGSEYKKTGNELADKQGARVLSELRSSENATGRENFTNEWAAPVVDKARTDAKTIASEKYRARDIGRLAGSVHNAIIDSTQKNVDAEIKKGIRSRAEELGIDKSTSKTASEIIFNAFMGEKLTMSQNRILQNNPVVNMVYNELKSADEVGIDEEYNNSWVAPVLENTGVMRAEEIAQLSMITPKKGNTVTGDGMIDNNKSTDLNNISTDLNNSSIPKVVNGTVNFDEFVSKTRAEKMNYGVVKKYNKTVIDNKTAGQIAVLDAYGRKHGLSFIVVDSIGSQDDKKANGVYIGKNQMLVSLDSEAGAMLSVAGHEVFHYIAKNDSTDADRIKSFVIDKLKSNDNYNYNERFAELSKDYGIDDIAFIEEEMVANSMFDIISNEDTVNQLSKENPTLLEKIVSYVKNFIDEIKNMAKNLPWKEVKVFESDMESLRTINAMAEAALWNIRENSNNAENSNNDNKSEENVIKSEENVNKTETTVDINAEKVSKNGENVSNTELNKFSYAGTKVNTADYAQLNKKYKSFVEQGNIESAQKFVDEAAQRAGYTIRAYHGTSRGDRVGNVFLPERATSGPMAFFTSSKDIASNYAKDKADTSLAYDEEYDDYYSQFRVNYNGESISVSDYWNKLSFVEKQKIKEKAKHVTFDDEAENIIYDENVNYGAGGFDAYRLNTNKGNALAALTEEWLVDGNLYGVEEKFLDVMKLVGIDNVEYRNPNVRHEKVYDTYLKIENPFRTEDVDSSFADSFLEWYDSQDSEKYERETANADMWDKNNITAEEWVENKLRDDIENGTTRAWTMIPDAVTDYLKSLGHDGIFDTGGKGGGESHTVYIPFSSSQIKSAEAVTYDDNDEVIPLINRFDSTKSDIRFSFQSVDKKSKTEYNKRKKKGSYYNEQETQFNIWQNSASTPVGAMKAFTRFDKKLHFYQKTEDSCVEITSKEFNSIRYTQDGEEYDKAEVPVDTYIENNGVAERRNIESDAVYGYSGNGRRDDNNFEREELQNEQSGNLERSRGDSEETSEIKLSLQETAKAGETREQLIKENANLRVANKLLKSEMQLTKGNVLPYETAKQIAKNLMKEYSSEYNSNDLAMEIYQIFDYYDGTGDYDYVMNYLSTVGKRVVARSSAVDRTLYEDYEDLRKWIRNMQFTLPEQVVKQLNENYDGKFVSKTFGRMRYVSRATHPDAPFLSQIYSELANEYPNFFSIEDNEYEQPMRLIEFWEKIQPTVYNPVNEMGYATEDDASVGFAFDVFNAYSKADKLETFADKKKNEIDKIRKEYDRNLERAKQKLTADRDRRLEWQKEYYINAREKSAEGRRKAYVKKKIRNVIKDLDKYLNRGSKEKNVKEGLQETVQTFLSAAEVLFSDVPSNENIVRAGVSSFTKKEAEWLDEYASLITKRDELLIKRNEINEMEMSEEFISARENNNKMLETVQKRMHYLDKCLEELFEREKIRVEGATVDEALAKLSVAYTGIRNSEYSYISNSFDENVYNQIESLRESLGGAKISLMSLSQLESVYDVYKMVLHTVRNANKVFTSEKKETAEDLGKIAIEEINRVGKLKNRDNGTLEKIRIAGWSELKPVYAFRFIGSNVLQERYAAMRNGEDTYYRDVSHAKEFYAKLRDKYKTDEWKLDKGYEFVSKDGDKFTLTLEQIMSIYAYSRRGETALTHLTRGGFLFSKDASIAKKRFDKNKSQNKEFRDYYTAYSLTLDVLGEINHILDDNKRAFVEEMQKYLSDVMGDKGNEVSMKMYGVKLFKEKNYFPLKSANQWIQSESSPKGEASLKNAGFSKETTPKANNPIVLDDFTNVWSNHVQDMAMYHSFVLPIEDFAKVYNYKKNTSETGSSPSLKATIGRYYGDGSTKYIDTLLTDLNSGVRSQNGTEIVNKLTGLAKKGAVFASASVVIQQPSAVVRATAHVNPKYFINAFPQSANWLKVSKEYEELKKYAPVAGIKEMGYFDTGLGKSTAEWITEKEYRGFGKKFKAFVSKDGKYRDDVFSQLAGKADEVSWVYIWNAVKKEVAEKQHLSGEALLNAAGKRFTEVIELTQVYDSVFSRSGLMRSKDTGVKMVTSFMAEPTTQVNMLFDALFVQGKRGNKKYTAAAVGAVYASILVNAMLKSIVTAGRDDEDEFSYTEKYISNLISSFITDGTIVSSIPFARDIISLVQGYDVERMDMTVIADVVNAFKALKSDKKTTFEKFSDIATSLLIFRGVPAKNIFKDIKMLYNTYQNIANGYEFSPGALRESIKREITGKSTPNADLLYNAIVSGDTEYAERLKKGFTESGYNSAVREGLMKYDSRIKDAAVARMNGNTAEYMRLAKEIIAEGNFSQDNVVSAIISTINSLSVAEDKPKEEKTESIFTDEDYFDALVSGDGKTADIVGKDLVETDVANGKTQEDAEKSLVSSLRNNVRDAFEAGELDFAVSKNILVKYGDMTDNEADNKLRYWDFVIEYPDITLDEEIVIKYYNDIEPSGISVDLYYEYYVNQKACKGEKDSEGKTISGSKKEQIMKVIDALPISAEQKDLLYFQNNWTESKLHEAPWH